ncbi:MAG: menaquinone biosynthesis protein [Nitrospirota bacterium]
MLRIGEVTYANLFPIFYMLERKCDCSKYEFIEGAPSTLNRMLRNGEIDISPSSSIEYLRYQNKYTIIEGHSISSKGPIGSILLFSRRPIERLNGMTALTSTQSESSVALLDIIFKKFYKIECYLRPTDEPFESVVNEAEAYLLIGDDALKAKKTVTSYKLQVTSKDQTKNSSLVTRHSSLIYIYDLGELWYKNTGLPFIFALWIVRKGCCTEKTELFERFTGDLNMAKALAMKDLTKIAEELRPLLLSRHSLFITEEELISYWKGISYDFTDEHRRGLELFRRYSEELGLLE